MPTYTVRDPASGKTVKLTGNSPPTENELNDIFSKIGQTQKTDYKQVIGSAVKSIFQKPVAYSKDLGTNPESMARAMPATLGTAGGMVYPFGGGTIGTGVGQTIRDVALKTLKKPVPGYGQHALELGTSVVGDLASGLGQMGHYKGLMNEAESKAGVPALQKLRPPSQATTAVTMYQKVKEALPTMTPMEARQIKPAFDWVARKGVLGNSEYAAEFFQVKKELEALVNKIPGRGAAASGLSRVYTVPRKAGQIAGMIPKPVARGLEYGVGQGMGGGVGFEVIRKLLGG